MLLLPLRHVAVHTKCNRTVTYTIVSPAISYTVAVSLTLLLETVPSSSLSPALSSILLMVSYTIVNSTVTCTIVKGFVSWAIFAHFCCHILSPTPAILLSSAPLSSELSPVNTFVSYTIVTSTIDNPTVTYTAVVSSSVT